MISSLRGVNFLYPWYSTKRHWMLFALVIQIFLQRFSEIFREVLYVPLPAHIFPLPGGGKLQVWLYALVHNAS